MAILLVLSPNPKEPLISDLISIGTLGIPWLFPVINLPWTVVHESEQGLFNVDLSILSHEANPTTINRFK